MYLQITKISEITYPVKVKPALTQCYKWWETDAHNMNMVLIGVWNAATTTIALGLFTTFKIFCSSTLEHSSVLAMGSLGLHVAQANIYILSLPV